MSYHRYATPAIILGRFPVGEASLLVFFFTRELGFITAIAQSARELPSKLRYALREFSIMNAEFIRGRSEWRFLGGETTLAFSIGDGELDALAVTASWSKLLRRLLHGEEANAELYDAVAGGMRLLAEGDLSAEERVALETLVVAHILHALGYWGEESFRSHIRKPLSQETLRDFAPRRGECVAHINAFLRESHL